MKGRKAAPRAEALVEITSLAEGGDGFGRLADGRVVFVSQTAPGDRARIALTEQKRSFARARLVALEHASADRVEPPCELARKGLCGGCPWMHLRLEVQHEAKQAIVAQALRHEVAAGLLLDPLLTPVPALGWRRRARLQWSREPRAKRAAIGFLAPRSHRVQDVPSCMQLEPQLDRALALVRKRLATHLQGHGELLFLLGHCGDVHLVVEGQVQGSLLQALVEQGAIAGARAGHRSWGAETIELEEGVQASGADFAQASAAGNDALRELVRAELALRADERVLELFAGGGNFTRDLVGDGRTVLAIEQAPIRPRKAPGLRHRRADAAAALQDLVERRERFDAALLDPPRVGAPNTAAALASLDLERLLYVSCNAATLARDLAELRRNGLHPVRATPLDLMPQTSEIELVVLLRAQPEGESSHDG